jgi:hypothetical protein
MKTDFRAFTMILLSLSWVAAAAQRRTESYPATQEESIQKTLNLPRAPQDSELAVDNIDGGIRVVGYDGPAVQLTIRKTIRGRTREDLDLALKEVELKISERSNRLELYVDGPFRCNDGSRRSRRLGYQVTFDFQLQVPRNCALYLRTVNHGDIVVENFQGKYDIKNVNGKIRMQEVGGAGEAHTVNGGVHVTFSHNPAGDCSYGSINGDLEVAFRQGISADFWFKTFNGRAYSDFELVSLPPKPPEQERRNGKFVYRSNRFTGARAGRGGPQIKLDAFNGNIRINAR